jgi:hypothetical protein
MDRKLTNLKLQSQTLRQWSWWITQFDSTSRQLRYNSRKKIARFLSDVRMDASKLSTETGKSRRMHTKWINIQHDNWQLMLLSTSPFCDCLWLSTLKVLLALNNTHRSADIFENDFHISTQSTATLWCRELIDDSNIETWKHWFMVTAADCIYTTYKTKNFAQLCPDQHKRHITYI